MVAVKNIKKFATENNSLKQSLPSCVSRVEPRTPMRAAITPLVKARTAISMACTTLQSSFSNQNDSLYMESKFIHHNGRVTNVTIALKIFIFARAALRNWHKLDVK